MKVKLLGLALVISLVSLLGLGACSTVQNVGRGVVMGVHDTVVGEVQLGAGLVKETVMEPSHATVWHWLSLPVDAAKVFVDGVHKLWHGIGHNLHGK